MKLYAKPNEKIDTVVCISLDKSIGFGISFRFAWFKICIIELPFISIMIMGGVSDAFIQFHNDWK